MWTLVLYTRHAQENPIVLIDPIGMDLANAAIFDPQTKEYKNLLERLGQDFDVVVIKSSKIVEKGPKEKALVLAPLPEYTHRKLAIAETLGLSRVTLVAVATPEIEVEKLKDLWNADQKGIFLCVAGIQHQGPHHNPFGSAFYIKQTYEEASKVAE